MPFTRKKRRMI